MSFWTILSCCFSAQSRGLVQLNNEPVSALFDTGSAISLVDTKYLKLIKFGQPKAPSIRLCGANGTPLQNKGTYELKVTVKGKSFMQSVHFIENLQIPCILGMDFMKRARISLDIGRKCTKMGRALSNYERILFLSKDVSLEPNSERQVDLQIPWTFDAGLVEGVHSLPDNI